MHTRRTVLAAAAALATLAAAPGWAQFTGPGASGTQATVAEARDARIGTYLVLEGRIVERLREDYYTFTDGLETIRVEIEPGRFAGRPVGPDTPVRITGEVDTGFAGRYLWVSALDIL